MKHNIEFVSYDGEYPCLCSGTLVVKIDGELVKFGTFARKSKNCKNVYPQFWASGGSVSFNRDWEENVIIAPWVIDASKEDYPHNIWILLRSVLKVMNKNVCHGCCGGCV